MCSSDLLGVELAHNTYGSQIGLQPVVGLNQKNISGGAALSLSWRYHSKDGRVSLDFGPFALIENIRYEYEELSLSRSGRLSYDTIETWEYAVYVGFRAGVSVWHD